MRTTKALVGSLVALVIVSAAARSEEKARPPLIPLRVEVVFNEYEGEKKVSSLPYSLAVNANARQQEFRINPTPSIHVGVNVPLGTEKDGHVHYEYVGTRIDCEAHSLESDRFDLNVNASRSSLYTPTDAEKRSAGAAVYSLGQPMLRRLDTNFDLVLRDGQTVENTLATDPITGHVWKIAVTLHVVK